MQIGVFIGDRITRGEAVKNLRARGHTAVELPNLSFFLSSFTAPLDGMLIDAFVLLHYSNHHRFTSPDAIAAAIVCEEREMPFQLFGLIQPGSPQYQPFEVIADAFPGAAVSSWRPIATDFANIHWAQETLDKAIDALLSLINTKDCL